MKYMNLGAAVTNKQSLHGNGLICWRNMIITLH